MNSFTNMKNVKKLSEQELYTNNKTSWHDEYRSSAWVFVGGFPFDLTEGDIICIFSQYGEIVNINLIREKDTGKSKGFCFICYEDQRSTVLAVDNFNGIKILNRTIRVDHVKDYKMPKDNKKVDTETKKLHDEGCAPKPIIEKVITSLESQNVRETLADQITADIKLPQRLPIYRVKEEVIIDEPKVIIKKKSSKKKSKRKKAADSSEEDGSSSDSSDNSKRKYKYKKKSKRN